MKTPNAVSQSLLTTILAACLVAPPILGQPAPGGRRAFRPGPRPPLVVSPEVLPDRRITFRVLAPRAETVQLVGSDIPGNSRGTPMTNATNGVWAVILGPLPPGAYRYHFSIDGVPVIDPRNPSVSESNENVWSLVSVPGSEFMDIRNVPHGAVASVTYYSTTLKRFRRLHIYTPPNYERGKEAYPVFYLLHGAGDSDDSWTSVGRAGFILDNLIADNRAKPMIVVMPAGHTRRFASRWRQTAPRRSLPPTDEFVQDFLQDLMPLVETHYRVEADRDHRAIAGLSMGGNQTLNIAIPHLDQFAYIGVFSSGLLGSFGPRRGPGPGGAGRPTWEKQHLAVLDNPRLKHGLKLLWFSTGRDDFLLQTSKATVALLKKHGFHPMFSESTGGHTWINWRNYLREFAPQLFR